MKAALIGPPQSGKSTVLAVMSGKEPAPAGSTHINEAIVPIPDARLDFLTGLYQPKKTVFATIDCIDLPGVGFADDSSRTAARRIISEAKAVDMFVLVVRAFEEESIPAYRGTVDAKRDIAELQTELLLADFELVATRAERLDAQIKKGSRTVEKDRAELSIHQRLQEALEAGRPARTVELSEQEQEIMKPLGLLTVKPIAVLVNLGEDDRSGPEKYREGVDESVPVFVMSAKLERELAQLDEASRADFMNELQINEPAYVRFVNSCYQALGLISFLTVGPDEVRAWPIRRGSTALDAAGKIHTDIKRGFIRAETMSFTELKEMGSEKAMKAAGRMRLEGKTYVVQDGDIVNFRFNV